VEIMMFIGFGYLMTFLKWYGFGAVGFTMLVTALGIQWYVFVNHWFHSFYDSSDGPWNVVPLNIFNLLDALFGIGAILISFGALIGKISPFQFIVMTVIELTLHAFNFRVILNGIISIQDLGGTYVVHMFGAYFGLAVAYTLGKPRNEPAMGYVPDMFSLIGSLFLWIYWPSFVAAEGGMDSDSQQRAIINTILSLAASTITTFAVSSLLNHKSQFRPVDIQNATLAGGVSIGCVANLQLSGAGAVLIGIIAGFVSCYGFNHIQPWLDSRYNLHDTCGIHNLHAMPSVIGAVSSVLLLFLTEKGTTQWFTQFIGIILTIVFAVVTGLLTGSILKTLVNSQEENLKNAFEDDCYWETGADYNPANSEIELTSKA